MDELVPEEMYGGSHAGREAGVLCHLEGGAAHAVLVEEQVWAAVEKGGHELLALVLDGPVQGCVARAIEQLEERVVGWGREVEQCFEFLDVGLQPAVGVAVAGLDYEVCAGGQGTGIYGGALCEERRNETGIDKAQHALEKSFVGDQGLGVGVDEEHV
jgi:hypothetical protein